MARMQARWAGAAPASEHNLNNNIPAAGGAGSRRRQRQGRPRQADSAAGPENAGRNQAEPLAASRTKSRAGPRLDESESRRGVRGRSGEATWRRARPARRQAPGHGPKPRASWPPPAAQSATRRHRRRRQPRKHRAAVQGKAKTETPALRRERGRGGGCRRVWGAVTCQNLGRYSLHLSRTRRPLALPVACARAHPASAAWKP